jgi:tetratricopeptide (TPR) repeat protein
MRRRSLRSIAASVRRRLSRSSPRAPAPTSDLEAAARRAEAERRWTDAAEAWRALLAAGSGDRATVLSHLGNAHRRGGDLEVAERVLAAAVTEFPEHVGVATEHAQVAVSARDWPAAVTRFHEVLARSGDRPRARSFARLARAQIRAGDPAAADATLTRGLRLHPDDLELALEHAELADLRRDWPTAVERWSHVVASAGGEASATAYVQLAQAYRQQGALDRADEIIERGRRSHPEDPDVAQLWAKLATVRRDPALSLERHTAAVGLPSGAPPQVHRDRARAAAAIGAWDVADEALSDGLAAHPDDPVLLVERAYMAIRRDDWDEVDRRWREAVERTGGRLPSDLVAGMARRCGAAFQHERADRVVADALATAPRDRTLGRQSVRNAIAVQRRERAPAEWDWSDALARSRQARDALGDEATAADVRRLATELAEASAVDEAATLLREGRRLHPGAAELDLELGLLAATRADWEEALACLDPHPVTDEAGFDTGAALVRARLALGDHAGARRVVEDRLADPRRAARSRAHIAAATGDHEEAAAWWLRAAGDAPASSELRRRASIALRRAGQPDTAAGGASLESNPGVVAIIGGGPSLAGVDLAPLRGRVHCVALNATALALPWADTAVTHDPSHLRERFRGYEGPVVAGLPHATIRSLGRLPGFELRRRVLTDRLSELDDVLHSGGHTSAYTALNYAYLLGAHRVVLFGVDLTALPRAEDYWHDAQDRYNRQRLDEIGSRPTFDRWWRYRARKLAGAPAVFASTLPQLEDAGVEVLNASPDSAVTCFPRVTPEVGVRRALEGDLGADR